MRLRDLQRRVTADEHRLAGALGGLLYTAAGVAATGFIAVPGASGSREDLALIVALSAIAYGVCATFLIPWERLPFSVLHVPTFAGLPLVIATSMWTGGSESPLRILTVFVAVWAACLCRARWVAVYLACSIAAFSVPFVAGQGGGGPASDVRELVMFAITIGAVTVTIGLLRGSLVRSRRRASRSAGQQRALRHVATAVLDGAPPDDVLALVACEAALVVGADDGGVFRADGDEAVLVGAWSSAGTLRYPVGTRIALAGDEVTGRATATGRAVQVRTDRDTVPEMESRGVQGAVAVAPIIVGGASWGVISVRTNDPAGLEADAGARLTDFAAIVATSIVHAAQRDVLEHQAFADPLTSLANHRAFHERLAGEIERAHRHDRPLSLVLVDVDAFKAINDSAGHAAGDRVLVQIAARLHAMCRAGDLLARVGGDEFAWLLPETAAGDALAVAERARAAVAAEPIAGAQVTISAGVCDLERARDADELFRFADGALYWSKAHGRDVARVYDPVVVRELSAAERAEQLGRHQALLGIRALARAIDAKDPSTREHSGRVADLACALARRRGWPEERVRLMEEAAVVHDVGKIGIADAILLKPGRLDPHEYAEVRRHAVLGAQIVEDVLQPEQVAWIRGHHERPDGTGYPDGLAAGELSEGAALLALADAYDVMTAARPYAHPKAPEAALAECRALAGRQFTAEAVAALEAVLAPGAVAA